MPGFSGAFFGRVDPQRAAVATQHRRSLTSIAVRDVKYVVDSATHADRRARQQLQEARERAIDDLRTVFDEQWLKAVWDETVAPSSTSSTEPEQ
jgi:hypothetical protein